MTTDKPCFPHPAITQPHTHTDSLIFYFTKHLYVYTYALVYALIPSPQFYHLSLHFISCYWINEITSLFIIWKCKNCPRLLLNLLMASFILSVNVFVAIFVYCVKAAVYLIKTSCLIAALLQNPPPSTTSL